MTYETAQATGKQPRLSTTGQTNKQTRAAVAVTAHYLITVTLLPRSTTATRHRHRRLSLAMHTVMRETCTTPTPTPTLSREHSHRKATVK